MTAAPHFDIDMNALWHDPYPQLARLRETAPVAFVPQLDGIVFTRRDDINVWEKRVDVFRRADDAADGQEHDAP